MGNPINIKYPLSDKILDKKVKDLKKDIDDIENINTENYYTKQETENAIKQETENYYTKQETENAIKNNIPYFIKTNEKGFFIVDHNMNIGFCVDENGAHSFNLVEHI